jgi:DNA-directed RNA polymerase specialized sigma subunit
MFNHELLTKEEEQRLGAQIRRSLQVQEAMAIWVEAEKERLQEEQMRLQRMGPEYNDDDDEEDDYLNLDTYDNLDDDDDMQLNMDDITNPLIFGTASSQAMERLWMSPQDGDEPDELFFQDGTPFDGQEAYGISTYDSIFEQHQQRNEPCTPESWMQDVLGMDHKVPRSMPSDEITITDEDVRRVLDLSGGRSQLRTILLDGALAREKLMRSNVKLVTSIAQKWVGEQKTSKKNSLVSVYNGGTVTSIMGRPTLEEAIQEGVLGLAEAAERFDPDKGFRFSTYATVWVTNSVRKCFQLESTSGMRLPTRLYEIKRGYVARVRHYLNTQQSVPSMDVIAKDLGITEKRLLTALRKAQPLESLDATLRGSQSSGAGKAGALEPESSDGSYTLGSLLAW